MFVNSKLIQIFQAAVVIGLVLAQGIHAAEVIIFDSRRPIAMSEKEKPFKDYYLNAGAEMGLKKGVVLLVQRRVPLYNTLTNSSAGDLQIQVAKIKIIHVQNRLSVARLVSESSRDELPVLEDPFILIGDHVDLGSASTAEADAPAGPDGSSPKETATFAPQETKPVETKPIPQPEPQAQVQPQQTPPPTTVAVELKTESIQKPTVIDNKSVERQTATLDNPTLQ